MGTQEYKIKVEYGVSAVVLLIGFFFIFQAFTIETSREAVGPRTMPLTLAISLVLGGLWLAIRAFTGRAGDLKDGYGFLESDIRRIVMVVGCGAFFCADVLGLWLSDRCDHHLHRNAVYFWGQEPALDDCGGYYPCRDLPMAVHGRDAVE